MNTKNKIIAILMAGIVAMAVGVPMAMSAQTPATSATVGSVDPDYSCTATVATAPGPGSDGTVNFELVVTDMNGAGDISNTGWTAEWGGRTAVTIVYDSETTTTKTFKGSDTIPYCTASGLKTVSFKEGTTEVCSASFTVDPYSGLSLNFDKVSFSGDPDTTNNDGEASLDGSTVAAPKIENIGNGAANVGIVASNLTKTDVPDIDGSNMEGTVGTTEDWQVIGTEYTWTTSLACGSDTPTGYRLDIPAGTPTGIYSGGLTITSR